MKKLVFFPLVLLALALSACGTLRGSGRIETETRRVSNFDEVTLAGSGEVIITQGDETALSVEADDNLMRYIKTEVHGGTLTLSIEPPAPMVSVWPTKEVKFYLTVTDLESVTVAGSGSVTSEAISADRMDLNVLGSGDIHLNSLDAADVTVNVAGSGTVNVDDLVTKDLMTTISGSGECTLQGDTVEQAVRVTGSGNYLADELLSESAHVTITGSGNGYVNVSERLDVRITGSGDLRYTGSPELTQTVLGSGDVSAVR
jgi:hypothetical protein